MKISKLFNIKNKGVLKANKTLSSKHYKIYEYLKKNAVGYQKRVKSGELMNIFEIKDNKTLRKYIQDIRQDEILQKIVCSESGNKGGYWIAKNDKEIKDTLDHLYKRSMEMLKTYSTISKKAKLDGQYKIKMSQYEKEIFESVMR